MKVNKEWLTFWIVLFPILILFYVFPKVMGTITGLIVLGGLIYAVYYTIFKEL